MNSSKQPQHHDPRQQKASSAATGSINTSWIKDGITKEAIEWAKKFGEELNEGKSEEKLTTSQIRKFFGALRNLQLKGYNQRELLRLKVMLAYATGKAKKNNRIKDFYKEIATAIDAVTDEKTFNNLVDIVEATVAYHKAAGGE